MRDAAVVAVALGFGFVLLSGTVLYSASRLERSLVSLDVTSGRAIAPRETGALPAVEGVKVNADGIRVDRVMTYDFFARYWHPDFAKIAERDCWAPLEKAKKYPSLPPRLQFQVELDGDGSVIMVHQGGGTEEPEGAAELRPCLTKIIQTMRFAPSGKRQTGPAQADRPQQN